MNRLCGAMVAMVLAACGFAPTEEVVAVECGLGTHREGTRCFSDTFTGITCGLGTHAEGSTCVPDRVVCGAGTIEQAGACVATLECGAGTRQSGTVCVASSGLRCGAGTVEQAGVCVSTLTCAAGTVQQGTSCVPGGSTVTCGPGTTQVGSTCIPSTGISCGAGTQLDGTTCVPAMPADGGWYEVRIGATSIPADGYTKIPVLAIGRLPSGAPATDAVLVSVSRPTAGTLLMPSLQLGPLGSTTWFTPCSMATASCAGTAKLELRLTADPLVIVAESELFTLIAPPGVGSTAPCDPSPNALFFDGMGYIFTGTQLVTQGTFSPNTASGSGNVISFSINPSSSTQGQWWSVDFAAPSGAGPLAPQVYPMAERYPFQAPGSAGLDVTGDGRGCNQSSGRFEIHKLTISNGQLTEFLATFEQFCEKQQSNVLRGCVKYTR